MPRALLYCRQASARNEHGEVVWRAKLPSTSATDTFTEMQLTAEGVSASSWSGYRVLIDSETGETLSDQFTK